MSKKQRFTRNQRDSIFNALFWSSTILGALLTGGIIFLGILLYQEGKFVGEGAIALATGGLALFTGFLWLSAAITARFARSEISTSTAVNSANLTLQLDNRFNSDRGLRIRHGAVTFLAKEKILNLPCHCNISPYSTDDDNLWYDLTPDLVDILNLFDWIGYLTSDECRAVDREVVRRKLGPWIVNYYEMCEKRVKKVKKAQRKRWEFLEDLYNDVKETKHPVEEKNLKDFLKREHVRSHRGLSGSQIP